MYRGRTSSGTAAHGGDGGEHPGGVAWELAGAGRPAAGNRPTGVREVWKRPRP